MERTGSYKNPPYAVIAQLAVFSSCKGVVPGSNPGYGFALVEKVQFSETKAATL
jgi:hypothetical protein